MKIEKYQPGQRLQPFVNHYMIIESETGMQNKILPDTSVIIGFRFRGQIRQLIAGTPAQLPGTLVSGLRESSRTMQYLPQTSMLLVKFTEGGAAALFKTPQHALFGLSVALDEVLPQDEVEKISGQLAEAGGNLERIQIIEKWLYSRIAAANGDPLILEAVRLIRAAGGNIKVKALLPQLYISRDPFEKRFRRMIGTSPKQFAAMVRLKQLIHTYSTEESLTSAALSAGYYDQAHFIRDFRAFTGDTPQRFFRAGVIM